MHADLSRLSYDRANGFNAVLALQGRVLLDADLNENTAILTRALRELIADVVGPHAGPEGETGFQVGPIVAGGEVVDLYLGPGRYYVDGLRVEVGADDDGRLLRRI